MGKGRIGGIHGPCPGCGKCRARHHDLVDLLSPMRTSLMGASPQKNVLLLQLSLTLSLTGKAITIVKIDIVNDIIIVWTNQEFIMTLTFSLTWGHWQQKIIKVERGLNWQSPSHWSCALSIELQLLAGFKAEIMNICFMISVVIDIVLDRQGHNHN